MLWLPEMRLLRHSKNTGVGRKCENLGEMISSDMAPFPKIVLINNNKYYEEKDRMLLTKDGKELVLFYGGESLKVPDTVEK